MTEKEITSAFQVELGRAPTPQELSHFLKMGEGQGGGYGYSGMNTYEAQQALQGTPEGQQKRLMGLAGVYEQNLAQGDNQILANSQNMLQGQFAGMGRGFSSGYVAAFANAARDLALARQQAKAGFIGQGLAGIMGNATDQGNAITERQYNLQDQYRQFQQQQDLANRAWAQQMDYQNTMMRKQRQQATAGLIGAGIGSLAGFIPGAGVAGAALGAGVGGRVGGMF